MVTQRQKSSRLETQLSAAQDRIGGAERRAKALEDENVKIKGELQTWNDYYEQETGVEMPNIPTVSFPMTFDAPTLINDNPSSTPSLPIPIVPVSTLNATVQQSGGIASGSSNVNRDDDQLAPPEEWPPLSWNLPPTERRVSFGSVFPGSNGTGGNGNGVSGSVGVPRTQVYPGSAATFNIGIKPVGILLAFLGVAMGAGLAQDSTGTSEPVSARTSSCALGRLQRRYQ